MQLITFVTLLKVDINLLSFLIKAVAVEADDHSNGKVRAESRGDQQAVAPYCFTEWFFCHNDCRRIFRMPALSHKPKFIKISAVELYF